MQKTNWFRIYNQDQDTKIISDQKYYESLNDMFLIKLLKFYNISNSFKLIAIGTDSSINNMINLQ